jgi:hypothetical protein
MRSIKLLLLAFLFLIGQAAYSQNYYYSDRYYEKDLIFEFGGGIGGMNSITDIGGPKGKGGLYIGDLNLKYTQMCGSVYFGALYQGLAGARLEATWGQVRGSDGALEGATGDALQRYNRNLNFHSNIAEIAVIAEFHPLAMSFISEVPPRLSPYIMAGLGWFSFSPQATINGREVDLRSLRTEGQGFPEYPGREMYHTKQANVPVGVGIKFDISDMFTLRAEALHRFLFTDYLDDVSTTYIDRDAFTNNLSFVGAAQANAVYDLKKAGAPVAGAARGNSSNKDAYMTFSLKVGIMIGRERR